MDPFEYRAKLMKDAEPANEAAQKRFMELVSDRTSHLLSSKIIGPYTTIETYWFGAETVTFIKPSSLHWVPLMRIE